MISASLFLVDFSRTGSWRRRDAVSRDPSFIYFLLISDLILVEILKSSKFLKMKNFKTHTIVKKSDSSQRNVNFSKSCFKRFPKFSKKIHQMFKIQSSYFLVNCYYHDDVRVAVAAATGSLMVNRRLSITPTYLFTFAPNYQ